MEVKNIEDLIGSLLTNGRKLVSYEQKPLLAPGENYGSIIVQVDLVFAVNEETTTIKCIGKLVPSSPFVWKVFNIPVTFKKEIGVYNVIVPTLDEFSREHGLDNLQFFADYIGSRISLNPNSTEVDDDAVLLLQHLGVEGYGVCDRFTGFDRKTTVMILRDLAMLHAAGIAYRLAKPEEFHMRMMPYLGKGLNQAFSDEMIQTTCERIAQSLSTNPDCVSLIDRMKANYAHLQTAMVDTPPPTGSFATITHSDLWTNNVMVKFENQEPCSIKLVDFQLVKYDSPANDVLFFLYTSVKMQELQNVDEYFKIYHDYLMGDLKKFNCYTTKFSMEEFRKELDYAAMKMQFAHIAFMLHPIFTQKGKAKEMSKVTGDDDMLQAAETLHENCHVRWQFLVQDFAKRNWI